MIPLFKQFPALFRALPYLPIAELPTPLQPCDGLVAGSGALSCHVKRDDQTGAAYGGNKVRKLAFLLGHARERGATSTLTFGAVGSNHALATAIYGRKAGFSPISMLVPQLNSRCVQQNLLRGLAAGAELKHFEHRHDVCLSTVEQTVAAYLAGEPRPYIIPAGGSSPRGTVGFVNGALELAEQIRADEMPAPDALYVPSGTMGTCVGLLIGLQLAGLKTTVVAVRVTAPPFTSIARARNLYARTVGLLRKADSDFPRLEFPEGQFDLRGGHLGAHYGRFTEAGMAAARLARERADVALEGTYTGKAMACLLEDGRMGQLAGKHVLYWNTYNSIDQTPCIGGLDYHQLPAPFHHYYEKAVQELDR